jgi:hypothetical protein
MQKTTYGKPLSQQQPVVSVYLPVKRLRITQTLHGTYEVVVSVSEGSLKEAVSLFIGIAAVGVTMVSADYAVARKNGNWLADQAQSFTETSTSIRASGLT